MKTKTRVKKKISKPTKSRVKKNQRIFIVFGICLGLFLLILFLNSKYFSKTKADFFLNINEIETKTKTKSEITPTIIQKITPTIGKTKNNKENIYSSNLGFSIKIPSKYFFKDNENFINVNPLNMFTQDFSSLFQEN